MHVIHFIIIFVIISIISCNADDKNNLELVESVNFIVDYDELSSNYIFSDSSTIFNPPLNWIKSSNDIVESLNRNLNNNDSVIKINIEDSFNSPNGSYILISRINSNESNFGYIPNDFLELMKDQYDVGSIISYVFKINNVLVKQYLIELDKVIIFKIFIDNNVNFQLDYIVNKGSYTKEIRSIESSIGSIKREEK